jgi:hypothetical protein
MGEVAGGEQISGTTVLSTDRPLDSQSIERAGGSRPWGIDQAWGVARVPGATYPGSWPRGSILISAFQHVVGPPGGTPPYDPSGLNINGDRTTELPSPMNPRLVMVSVAGVVGATLPSPSAITGPCANPTAPGDRLSNVRSQHEGGSQFLMGDGTVRFVSENVDLKVYGYLFTVQGKEIVDEDDF